MRGSDSDCVRVKQTVRAFGANTYSYDAYGTGTPPREGSGDRHHAIIDPDEMIRHECDDWDKDPPSE